MLHMRWECFMAIFFCLKTAISQSQYWDCCLETKKAFSAHVQHMSYSINKWWAKNLYYVLWSFSWAYSIKEAALTMGRPRYGSLDWWGHNFEAQNMFVHQKCLRGCVLTFYSRYHNIKYKRFREVLSSHYKKFANCKFLIINI